MSTENSPLPVEIPEVHAVGIKLPAFWEKAPELWFVNVEAQFSVSRIVCDRTKYFHIISTLNSETLSYVSDIVLNPPAEDKYSALKTRLISEFSDSEQKRIKALLSELVLGDDKPSHLLRKMRNLADKKLSDEFLKTLWIQRLPESAQAIISISEGNLDKLSLMADKILDISPNTSKEVHAVKNDVSEIAELKGQIAALTEQVSRLTAANERQPRYRSRHFSQGRYRSQTPRREQTELCWYHQKFGNKAKKCNQPCKFSEN
ncbi:uncharacterized protein [Parasteatoda tepidariorum]|uniref:uncharacterized protein n=1 Tax=Parasteatoda tepidariorum TaxID=114398 RepID=UPI001C729029|nr:uncharacterized protein LOC107447367 [Parasteatoda tepidariorum]